MAADEIDPTKPHTHGPWTYDPERLVVTHRDTPSYEIDLEQMTTSAEVLDWIVQLNGKVWITAEDMGHFVELLDRLLYLQGRYCSGGTERGPVDVLTILTNRGMRLAAAGG